MRGLVRRLILDQAQETRVFLGMAAFGFAVGVIYWFVSYEPAGTILLIGFGLATAVIFARLAADPATARIRRVQRERRRGTPGVVDDARRPAAGGGDFAGDADVGRGDADVAGGGTASIDRPFLDEDGRFPDDSIAPFAVGLGVAVAATGLIFGPAPVIVGILPVLWGAWNWLLAAGDELAATRDDDGGT